MMRFVWSSFLVGLALSVVPPAMLSAQPAPSDSAHFWQDPGFVARFLGTYGFEADREPKITVEEQKLFESLVPFLRSTNQNDRVTAANTLRSGITANSSAALDFTLGNIYSELGNFEAAAAAYQTAIRKFSDFMRAHKNLGLAWVQQGKFAEAIQSYVRALELGGEDGNVYGVLGFCYLNQENYFSAEAAYRKALLFAPLNLDWKLGVARCLLAQEKYRDAASLFNELILGRPDRMDFWLHQANAYIGLAEPLKAARNYEIVRRMGKADGRVLNNLGDIYLAQEMRGLAFEAYLESLKTDPNQDIARPVREAEMLANQGAMREAIGLLERIEANYGDRIEPVVRLKMLRLKARGLMSAGEDAAAAKTLEELVREDPLDGESLLLLAHYYGRTEPPQAEKAQLLYQRAADIEATRFKARVQHAQLEVRLGRYGEAVKLLQAAQQLDNPDYLARYLEQVQRLARVSR